MCLSRLRVILTTARQHVWNKGIMSIFNEMSETNFNPTLLVEEANISHTPVGHNRITLKQMKFHFYTS